MSATERLRELLDERGVEYEVDDAKTVRVTRWRAYGDWVSFIEYDNGDTKFCIDARRLTPEQAVDATLGTGTCRMEPVKDYPVDECVTFSFGCVCSECGTFFEYTSGHNWRYYPNCRRKVVTNG